MEYKCLNTGDIYQRGDEKLYGREWREVPEALHGFQVIVGETARRPIHGKDEIERDFSNFLSKHVGNMSSEQIVGLISQLLDQLFKY